MPALWVCPRCGRSFAARHQTHTCAALGEVEGHFAGCEPSVRATYDAVLAVLAGVGPFEVLAEKTRIALHVRMSFAAFMPRRSWLRGHLVLAGREEHPRVVRTTTYSPHNVVHEFVLRDPAEVDEAFVRLLTAAYGVGEQRHRRDRQED